MTTVNKFIKKFGCKSSIILQQQPAKKYVAAKADGQIILRKQYRGRWMVVHGLDFIVEYFNLKKGLESNMLSNNRVKELLRYAKKHPNVLKIAFLQSEEPSVSDDLPTGDTFETELPESDEVGDSSSDSGGDIQS